MLLVAFAFLAGVVTIASPCILPLLPIVLAGSAGTGRARPYAIVAGFVLVFSLATLTFSLLVQSIGLPVGSLRVTAVAVLTLFGAVLLIPRLQLAFESIASRLATFGRSVQRDAPRAATGLGSGLVIGATLGLVWAPCVGPIMASVITLAAAGDVGGMSVAITLAYAAGTAIPMFLIIIGGKRLIARIGGVKRASGTIQRVFAALMIVTGVGIAFNADRAFQAYILDTFPALERSITFVEHNDVVDREIERLLEE